MTTFKYLQKQNEKTFHSMTYYRRVYYFMMSNRSIMRDYSMRLIRQTDHTRESYQEVTSRIKGRNRSEE